MHASQYYVCTPGAQIKSACLPCLLLQLSQAFKPAHDDMEYAQGKYMLEMLGLKVRRLVCCGSREQQAGFSNAAEAAAHSAMALVWQQQQRATANRQHKGLTHGLQQEPLGFANSNQLVQVHDVLRQSDTARPMEPGKAGSLLHLCITTIAACISCCIHVTVVAVG
eukprot:GHRR01033054.1.p1 GENE.GHRR01033054.1~~GHRR01033054.1.p1  ORF type:complete len:166 (+),score=45.77 GHRR01033054.1:128-625(+)